MNKNLFTAILGIVCLLIAYGIGRTTSQKKAEPYEVVRVERDTIHDTIRVVEKKTATRIIKVRDTIVLDSTRIIFKDIKLPTYDFTYTGDNYKMVVNGYAPEVKSMDIYQETKYVRKKPPRWSLGVGVGYGLGVYGLQPYVGVNLSYTIVSW